MPAEVLRSSDGVLRGYSPNEIIMLNWDNFPSEITFWLDGLRGQYCDHDFGTKSVTKESVLKRYYSTYYGSGNTSFAGYAILYLALADDGYLCWKMIANAGDLRSANFITIHAFKKLSLGNETVYGFYTLLREFNPGLFFEGTKPTYYIVLRSTQTLSITTESPITSALEEVTFERQLEYAGTDLLVTWFLMSGSLPPGLSMSSSGLISGTLTETAAGSYSFTIRVVSDSGEWGEKAFAWNIDANSVVIDTATPMADINDCTAVSLQFEAHGSTGPYTWQVTSGSLPGGLSLSSDGLLTGTPDSSAGTFNFGVTATASTAKTGQKDFSVVVSLQAPTVNGGVQVVMEFNLDGNPNPSSGDLSGYASGGKAPYSWSWVSGSGNIGVAAGGGVSDSTLGYSDCVARCTGSNGASSDFILIVTVGF